LPDRIRQKDHLFCGRATLRFGQQPVHVIDAVKKHNIPVVFSESTISDAPAKQVARETGAKYGGVLYVDSLSEADGIVPTYIDLLKVTSSTIAKGLAK